MTGVVNAWDPYGLIELGCPSDEFDGEVNAVVNRLSEIGSPQDAARVLSEVFGEWFSPEDFPVVSCIEPGQRLWLALRSEGLVR